MSKTDATPAADRGSECNDLLGPLPRSDCIAVLTRDGLPLPEPGYSATAVRAYVAQEVAAERERCAKLCEDISERHLRSGRYVSVVADHSVRAGGQVDGADECARAIRGA